MSLKNSGTYSLGRLVVEREAPRGPGSETRGATDGTEDPSCDEVDVEIIANAMPARGGREPPGRSPRERVGLSSAKTWSWPLPAPACASGDGTRRSDPGGAGHQGSVQAESSPSKWSSLGGLVRELRACSAATRGVSMLATVGVGEGEPRRPLAASPPRPPRQPSPTSGANNPTQIFKVPAAAPLVRDAQPSEAGRRTAALPSLPPSNGKASPPGQTPAPLLRAFDDKRPCVAAWSTAKTVTAPVPATQVGDGGSNPPADVPEGGEPKSPTVRSRKRVLGNLRSPAVPKKISRLVLAAMTLIALGSVAARSLAPGFVPSRPRPAAAAPARAVEPSPPTAKAAAHEEPEIPIGVKVVPPDVALGDSVPVSVEAAQPAPPARTLSIDMARVKARPVREGRASKQVTLARQAVDALLAGDRPKALLHYRELSRTAPEREAYREAVRVLTPLVPDAPN